jgi:uncharacterized protein (TIGR03067 family)
MNALVPVLFAAVILAPSQHPNSSGDAALVQGGWRVVKAEREGQSVGSSDAPHRLVFTGDKVTVERSGWTRESGTFGVSGTTGDGKLVWRLAVGEGWAWDGVWPKRYHTFHLDRIGHGIYQLRGNELTLCLAEGTDGFQNCPKKPPTEFATRPGDGRWLLVLDREKPLLQLFSGATPSGH